MTLREEVIYRNAALVVRKRLHEGETGLGIREAVEAVRDLAPKEHQQYWKGWADALASGRRIKFATAEVSFTTPDDGVTPELVAEIEDAFTNLDDTE